jgi:hypothetical protein
MSVTVGLNWNEVRNAANAGMERFIRPIQQGNKNQYGAKNSLDNDFAGCLAEMAVAKYLGKYWHASPAVDARKITNDVGDLLEVRCSRTGKLIIRDRDKAERMYVNVLWPEWTDQGCKMTIIGGMLANDARQDKWLDAPAGRPPAHFVPQSALIPAEQILTRGE